MRTQSQKKLQAIRRTTNTHTVTHACMHAHTDTDKERMRERSTCIDPADKWYQKENNKTQPPPPTPPLISYLFWAVCWEKQLFSMVHSLYHGVTTYILCTLKVNVFAGQIWRIPLSKSINSLFHSLWFWSSWDYLEFSPAIQKYISIPIYSLFH